MRTHPRCAPRAFEAHSERDPSTKKRRGYTLVEMVASVGAASVLTIGLASTILISSAAMDQDTTTRQRTVAADTQTSLLSDLRHATAFTERTANAVTIVVPDRTGDGQPDSIRYTWSGTPGDPLEYSVNGSTAQTLVADVHEFALAYQTETIVAPEIPEEAEATSTGTVMFVSGGSIQSDSDSSWMARLFQPESAETNHDVDTTPAEEERIALLEVWGYTVNKIGAFQSQGDFDKAMDAADLIYIAPNPVAVACWDKLEGTSLGIVNECTPLVADIGFGDDRQPEFGASVTVADNSHYLVADFESGQTVTLFPGPQLWAPISAPLGAGAQVHATSSTSSLSALVALAPGAQRYGGGKAGGRRVWLPWAYPDSSIDNLSTDGQLMMRRAVEWAGGEGEDGGVSSENFGNEDVYANNTSWRRDQVATKVALDKPGTLQSISVHLGAKDDDLRVAIYSDGGGEPSVLIVESTVVTSSGSGGWNTVPVPETHLAAGTYWLAACVDHRDQKYSQESPGETRMAGNQATSNGFTATWSTSKTQNWAVSMYATFLPD